MRRAEHTFAARFGDRIHARHWWVPGRIEVLGKHVDYGGGRSLLTAVNRGFHVLARPRTDGRVHLVDARSGITFTGALVVDQPHEPGRWSDYPATVLRRIARDFPSATVGMDAVVSSSLPSASGLSSSSAMVIAVFLPLRAFNALDATAAWQEAIPHAAAMAGYLGALENGRSFGPFAADFGVGTHGGSQDHTAILCAEPAHLVQYRFLPVARETAVALPAGWTFVVVSSGVSAPKAGNVRERYNRLSQEAATLLDMWRQSGGAPAKSLLDVLSADTNASARITAALSGHADARALRLRLQQFREECCDIIPRVVERLATGDVPGIGTLIDRSQWLADQVLGNQIDETRFLASRARELGAAAASAFGAGFGGSVWALVEAHTAEDFSRTLVADYLAEFPLVAHRLDDFVSPPGRAACEIG